MKMQMQMKRKRRVDEDEEGWLRDYAMLFINRYDDCRLLLRTIYYYE
jgi:hypothetical protein